MTARNLEDRRIGGDVAVIRKNDRVRYVGPSKGLHSREFDVVTGERFGWVKVRFGLGALKLQAVFLEVLP